MNTNHNRIKVADLETNSPDKALITNGNGELEFKNIDSIKVDCYNALDYTLEGKALDARQGKILKDSLDNIENKLSLKEDASNKVQDIETNKNSLSAFPTVKSIYNWTTELFKKWVLDIEDFSENIYTMNSQNINKRTIFNAVTPVSFIVPSDASVDFPIGTQKKITQKQSGVITITGTGVTFFTNIPLNMVIGETRTLTKIGVNEWLIEGSKNDISQLTDNSSILVQKTSNTIFVNNITGNDNTAQFENPNKPFATMQKALEFQSSLEGWTPRGIKIVITNGNSYSMGTKMLSNAPNSETNILLLNLSITGSNQTPTLVFTNGAFIGTTTLDNINITHQQLTHVPISGGLNFNAGHSGSVIKINVVRLSNITGAGNIFSLGGLFRDVLINDIIIDSTCTNSQLNISALRTLGFAKINSITNNANSFSGSSSNSIFSPPHQDFEFSSITNNSTVPISLWGEWSSTPAIITIGNISSPNVLMRIPLGIASGDYGLNTKIKLHFKNSIINNCWISGNTLNSQCYVFGKATFNYSLQSPFMTVTRSRLKTDFSNKDTCVLKDLELTINYSTTPTFPIVSIPNVINNGSVGMSDGEAQIILENVKIMTNLPIEVFKIPASSKLDTPRLIIFRGFNAFNNSKELINIGITPTESKYLMSQQATIYHPFNILSNNPSLFISQEQSY